MPRWKDNDERGAFGAWLSDQVGERTFDWLAAQMAERGHAHGADYYRAMASGAKPPGRVIGRALREFFGAPPEERKAAAMGEATLVEAIAELVAEMRADRTTRRAPELVAVREAPATYVIDLKHSGTRRQYWLRRARERLKMTREEVDRLLEARAGQYGRWEDGKTRPSDAQLARLAAVLRVPLAILADPPETDEDRLEAWQQQEVREETRQRRSA